MNEEGSNDDEIFRRHRIELVDNVVCTESLLSYNPSGRLTLDDQEMVLCAEGNRNCVEVKTDEDQAFKHLHYHYYHHHHQEEEDE